MVFSCLLKGFRIRKHFFKRFPIFVTPIKYNTCMNKTILLVVFCFSLFVSGYSQGIRFDSYPSHPRLLVKKGEEQKD